MKTRWFVVLLALNLGLFALCCFLVLRGFWERPQMPSLAEEKPELESKAALVNEPDNLPATNSPPPVIVQTNVFHWSQIESGDYRQYIANLRAVGCPEATIKDIILTDIMRLFAERRGQLSLNGREFRYWETNEKRTLTAKQAEERDRQLAKIDKQVPSVLRELLGLNYEREVNKYFVDTREDDRRLSFLSEDKRPQLLTLREEIEDYRERLLEGGNTGAPAFRQIDDLRQRKLAVILTPEEIKEYELRTSETADRLRTELVGFNPSEEEFRQLFHLQREFDEKFAQAGPEAEATKAEERKRLEQTIKSMLGADRLADYQRARSKDYQDLCYLSEKHELPRQTAQTVLDYRQVVEQERARILESKEFSEETRLAALKAIEAETIAAMRQNLGDAAFADFIHGPGSWLQNLRALSAK